MIKMKLSMLLLMLAIYLMSSPMFMMFLNNTCLILELDIFKLSSVVFSFTMIIDKVSLSFSLIVVLISFSVFTFACKYMENDLFFNRFILILISFVISMNILIFSGSLFFLLLGWDGLGITSFILIIYYQSKKSLLAGFKTLMVNRIGDILIIFSVIFMLTLGQMNLMFMNYSWALLLSVAALTKSAQFPFSSWLPAAMAAPTPVSALVHSSTLVTAGIFLIIRISSFMQPNVEMMSLLLFCGSTTSFMGGLAALYENDLKKIVALSTLSQLGVMIFSLGMGLPYMALFHLYTHAMFKALLFLVVGTILLFGFGNQDIRMIGKLNLPIILIISLNISSLCLISMPFLSSFYSKHIILELTFMFNINLLSMLTFLMASVLTVAYVIRMVKSISWTSCSNTTLTIFNSQFLILLPMLLLLTSSITMGKMFKEINMSVMVPIFLPSTFSMFINLILILGLVLSFLKFKSKKYFIYELLYLTPVFSLSPKLIKPFLFNLSVMDYGWVEPMTLKLEKFLIIPLFLVKIFLWPNSSFSFMRIMVILILLFYFIINS